MLYAASEKQKLYIVVTLIMLFTYVFCTRISRMFILSNVRQLPRVYIRAGTASHIFYRYVIFFFFKQLFRVRYEKKKLFDDSVVVFTAQLWPNKNRNCLTINFK